ncbi:hypothetical protein BH23GEM6_BH23GEM6_15970 [soil metagenome]
MGEVPRAAKELTLVGLAFPLLALSVSLLWAQSYVLSHLWPDFTTSLLAPAADGIGAPPARVVKSGGS